MTGDNKYFDDAANQVLNYTRYLWCPEKEVYYHCYHTDTKIHGVAHWSRANGWVFIVENARKSSYARRCHKELPDADGWGNPLSGR